MTTDRRRLAAQRRRVDRARASAAVTCPASRHLHMMADALVSGRPYHMLTNEPEHCGETMLSVLESLWKMRAKWKGKWP